MASSWPVSQVSVQMRDANLGAPGPILIILLFKIPYRPDGCNLREIAAAEDSVYKKRQVFGASTRVPASTRKDQAVEK
jgi:hypothetical protein